ncbi:hypothetical protein NS383_14055 [Pseudomonas oryzihabitans]|nr:hypothetical protein NS383_14055 [Pseudomonas psychrotolerans]
MLDSTSLPAHQGTINTEAQRRLATASRSRASQEARAWAEEHLTQDVPHAGDLRRAILPQLAYRLRHGTFRALTSYTSSEQHAG